MAEEGSRGFAPTGPRERREPLYPKQLHEWGGHAVAVAGVVHIVRNGRARLCYIGLGRRRLSAQEPVRA